MAINNVSWGLNEKITSTKLNQMCADEVNSTDNIHPQYTPHLYDSRKILAYHRNDYAGMVDDHRYEMYDMPEGPALFDAVTDKGTNPFYLLSGSNQVEKIMSAVIFQRSVCSSIDHIRFIFGADLSATAAPWARFKYQIRSVAANGATTLLADGAWSAYITADVSYNYLDLMTTPFDISAVDSNDRIAVIIVGQTSVDNSAVNHVYLATKQLRVTRS